MHIRPEWYFVIKIIYFSNFITFQKSQRTCFDKENIIGYTYLTLAVPSNFDTILYLAIKSIIN